MSEARVAFETAQRLAHDEPSYAYAVAIGRARFEFFGGGDLDTAATAADDAVANAKGDEHAKDAAAVAAAVARARGDVDGACRIVNDARRRFPDDARFNDRRCPS